MSTPDISQSDPQSASIRVEEEITLTKKREIHQVLPVKIDGEWYYTTFSLRGRRVGIVTPGTVENNLVSLVTFALDYEFSRNDQRSEKPMAIKFDFEHGDIQIQTMRPPKKEEREQFWHRRTVRFKGDANDQVLAAFARVEEQLEKEKLYLYKKELEVDDWLEEERVEETTKFLREMLADREQTFALAQKQMNVMAAILLKRANERQDRYRHLNVADLHEVKEENRLLSVPHEGRNIGIFIDDHNSRILYFDPNNEEADGALKTFLHALKERHFVGDATVERVANIEEKEPWQDNYHVMGFFMDALAEEKVDTSQPPLPTPDDIYKFVNELTEA